LPVAAKIALHTAGSPRSARLADAAGAIGALHDVHFGLRRLVDAEQIVIVEVRLLDAAVGNGDFALKRS
jgi:hypothetical protein